MSIPKLRFKADDGNEFPEWEEKRLGDICDIKTGPFGSTLHASDYVEDGTPIVTTEHFKSGSLPVAKQGIPQVSDRDIQRLSSYLLRTGDIVFSRVGSVDVNALVTTIQKGWLFSGRVLRVRPGEGINSLYLHYELSTSRVRKSITDRAVGQTMPSINTDILKKTQVFIPSCFEQQKIADCLSVIDNVMEQTQSEIDAWEKQKRGVMQMLFSRKVRFKADDGSEFPEWEEKKLLDCVSLVQGLTYTPDKIKSTGTLVLRSSNIQDHQLSLEDNVYVDILVSEKQLIQNKDILVCVRNGSAALIGKSCVLPEMSNTTFGAFMSILRGDETGYISQIFETELVQKQLRGKSSATINQITKRDFEDVIINIPKSELEQQKIAACLSGFDDVIDKAKKELEACRELKKGLLQQMFV